MHGQTDEPAWCQVSVVVAALGAQGPASVLAEATDACFGAANFDHRLFAHFAKHIASKYAGASVVPGASVEGC